MLRPASLGDVAAAVRLVALVNPEWLVSAESFRHNLTSTPAEARRGKWCIERDDELIGWASSLLMVATSESGSGLIVVNVHPLERRKGLGSALLEVAERHAADIGVRRLVSFSCGDEESAGFARAHGYEQTASNEIFVLDPSTIESPTPPAGVELRPFAEFTDDPSPIYDVDVTAMLDEPGDALFDAMTYDYWLERFWRSPLVDLDSSTAVLVDGKVVAITMLQVDPQGERAQNNGTCTLREYRGRGLAMLAKQESLARLGRRGCRQVYTGNDETNAAMLAINRKLGYRPCTTELSWSKPLAATSEP